MGCVVTCNELMFSVVMLDLQVEVYQKSGFCMLHVRLCKRATFTPDSEKAVLDGYFACVYMNVTFNTAVCLRDREGGRGCHFRREMLQCQVMQSWCSCDNYTLFNAVGCCSSEDCSDSQSFLLAFMNSCEADTICAACAEEPGRQRHTVK